MSKEIHAHPSEFIKEIILEPLNITPMELGHRIGFSRVLLASLINQKITMQYEDVAELAIRLEEAGFSTAQFWMNIWSNYSLDKVRVQIKKSESEFHSS